MKQARNLLPALIALAFLVGIFGTQGAQAQSQKEYKPKAKVTSLVKTSLAGVQGKDVIIKHFELPANYVGGKHWHPGQVFVYVLEGEFTVELDEGIKTIKAGEVYMETPKVTMRAKNLSTTKPLKIVVFQVGDTGKPMMIKAK